jgi:hypothetical protein
MIRVAMFVLTLLNVSPVAMRVCASGLPQGSTSPNSRVGRPLPADSPEEAPRPRQEPPIADADPSQRQEQVLRVPTRRALVPYPEGGFYVRFDTCCTHPIKTSIGHKMAVGYRISLYYWDGASLVYLSQKGLFGGSEHPGKQIAIFYGLQQVADRIETLQLISDLVFFVRQT